MLRSLWSSASGMIAQQTNLDVVSNNLANVNTAGYKRQRADFQDLLYQINREVGTPVDPDSQVPTGVQVGLGTRVVGTSRIMSIGNLQVTENPLDIAIAGNHGYFQVIRPNGDVAYTRAGAWQVDADGQVVNQDGLLLEPSIVVPEDTVEIIVQPNGAFFARLSGEIEPLEIGQIELARFVNPAGLRALGGSLFEETPASGAPIVANPGEDGMSEVRQRILEMSNVQIVEEMVDMIIAQRAYEANSKTLQTADNLLQTAVGLKR